MQLMLRERLRESQSNDWMSAFLQLGTADLSISTPTADDKRANGASAFVFKLVQTASSLKAKIK